jgi:dTMP kinase
MIHMLFVLNRWEIKKEIEERLNKGQNVVLDRYSYSGIAYTAAKGIEVDWCIATEKGLPKPDFVYYLKVNNIKDLESRGGYG